MSGRKPFRRDVVPHQSRHLSSRLHDLAQRLDAQLAPGRSGPSVGPGTHARWRLAYSETNTPSISANSGPSPPPFVRFFGYTRPWPSSPPPPLAGHAHYPLAGSPSPSVFSESPNKGNPPPPLWRAAPLRKKAIPISRRTVESIASKSPAEEIEDTAPTAKPRPPTTNSPPVDRSTHPQETVPPARRSTRPPSHPAARKRPRNPQTVALRRNVPSTSLDPASVPDLRRPHRIVACRSLPPKRPRAAASDTPAGASLNPPSDHMPPPRCGEAACP